MYKRSAAGWSKHFDFILLDLLCLQVAYFGAYMVRNGWGNPYTQELYLHIGVILALVSVVTAFFTEMYSGVLKRGLYKELVITTRQTVIVELIAAFYLFSIRKGEEFSRTVLFLTGVFYLLCGYAVRMIWKRILEKKTNDTNRRSLLIVTTKELAEECVRQVKNGTHNMFCPAGIVVLDGAETGTEIDGIKVVTDREHIIDYVCGAWVDEVLINLPPDMPTPDGLVDAFSEMGIVTHLALVREHESCGRERFIEKLGAYTVLTTSISTASPSQMFLKRTVDILGGITGCIVTVLLYLVIAPVIWVQSPGPVFFKQTRIGKNGRKFEMYKFRTMYPDAEERKAALMQENRVKDGMMFKLEFDPRVIGNRILADGTRKTGIMEFVRKTSLDEFPQFYNVLKGEMSLVGTRPPTQDEWEKYELHHHARLAMKPGITGMWQVSGRSEITDFEEVVKLDTQYISEWSMGLDLRILMKTVSVVLKREGAM